MSSACVALVRPLLTLPCLRLRLFALCSILAWRTSSAQATVVRVQVTDSSSQQPVAGAEVSIVGGLNTVLTHGVTDGAGRRALAVRADSGSYQLVVRAIGFIRADRFFVVHGNDTMSLAVTMTRVAQQLASVHIEEEQDLKRLRLFIDAEGIASSERPIFDAVDVVAKLRPDMMGGLGQNPLCFPAQEIWVNGVRIEKTQVPRNEDAIGRANATIPKSKTQVSQGYVIRGPAPHVVSVLASIKPEHIAQMVAHDCNDNSVSRTAGENTVFVTLKPGVAFEPGRGSYVPSTVLAVAPPPAAQASLGTELSRAGYRRVLGVFDAATGDALRDTEIVDSASRTIARTAATGLVTLSFATEGSVSVRVRKTGYAEQVINFMVSGRDTAAVMVLLLRR